MYLMLEMTLADTILMNNLMIELILIKHFPFYILIVEAYLKTLLKSVNIWKPLK